jgi:cellulose synthase/poly-beta-1,6-N-acetylglucosamine synthase-like glycosyltransferase
MIVLQILFWLAVAWIIYANVGYLALLASISRLVRQPVRQAEITPAVSLLIAARNEEAVIAEKLENSLALDYPQEQLQVIVVSDASTDRTDAIVQEFAGRGVLLHRVADGKGKVNALNTALPLTTGDILVISDADSHYAPNALRKLVRNFADPSVGAVTGEERRLAAAGQAGLGESLYCRMDNLIKRLEGQLGSIVMVNGGFFAIRRELYPVLPAHLIHDSIVPCTLQLQGYRTAYEREALSLETYPLEAAGDFRRRLRTVLQAFSSYLSIPAALNPFRTGRFAFQLLSHRFSRWFVMPWLAVALLCNAILATSSPFYLVLLLAQLGCYALALGGWLLDRRKVKIPIFYIPYYFVYIHLAAFVAVVQVLLGHQISTWQPTKRGVAEE